MDRSAGDGATVRWRLVRASELPLKPTGEEPASIGDVSLCDDTPIKRFGVPPAATVAAPLTGGGAQSERAVNPDNDRERARHPRDRPSRDATGELRFDRSMKPLRQIIVFDTADLAAEITSWAGLLEGTVEGRTIGARFTSTVHHASVFSSRRTTSRQTGPTASRISCTSI